MLWSGMLEMGRGGQQQLRYSKQHQALVSPSEHKLIRQTMPDKLFNKTQPVRLTREGSDFRRFPGCRQKLKQLNIVYIFFYLYAPSKTIATPNGSVVDA
jgi:hypothetical protein